MNGGDPPWVKVVLGLLPLIAAVIAGIFALANTRNRRIERFKNLVESRRDYPDELNPHKYLDLIIIRELYALEVATSSRPSDRRALKISGALLMLVGYAMIFGVGIYRPVPETYVKPILLVGGAATLVGAVMYISVLGFELYLDRKTSQRVKQSYAELFREKAQKKTANRRILAATRNVNIRRRQHPRTHV